MQYIETYKQLVKNVEKHGNSGGIYLPVDWVGQRVLVRPLSITESIMQVISPYSRHILGICLYGSYARGEQTPDSDIDILVITDKDMRIGGGLWNMDIETANRNKIEGMIRNDPVGYYSMIREAVPILNEKLLEELRRIEPDLKQIRTYYKMTKSMLGIVRGVIDIKGDLAPCVYSLILRLRGLFLIQCNLKKRKYSNAEFEDFVVKHGINRTKYRRLYDVYRAKRDNKPVPKYSIPVKDVEMLYKIVEGVLKWQKEQKGRSRV